MAKLAKEAGVDTVCNRLGSMATWFFSDQPITDYASASKIDTKAYATYFHSMLEQGIYLAPSAFEAAFISTSHSEEDLNTTLAAAKAALHQVKTKQEKAQC